jgi:hypothetical protein
MSAVRAARGISKRRSWLTPEMTAMAARTAHAGSIGSTIVSDVAPCHATSA